MTPASVMPGAVSYIDATSLASALVWVHNYVHDSWFDSALRSRS